MAENFYITEDPQCKELYDFIENGDLAKLQATLRKNASTRDTAAISSIDNVLTMYHVKAAAKVSAKSDHLLGNGKSQVRGSTELSEIDESDATCDDSEGDEFDEETVAVATPSRIPPVVPNNAGQKWEEMKRDFYKNVKLTRIDDGLRAHPVGPSGQTPKHIQNQSSPFRPAAAC
ncbi:hypothetical protein HDU89_004693 [Geranomyces variabilis]|nr:hypothetical protein HDU89_004693 [Geranomyces variabilis]